MRLEIIGKKIMKIIFCIFGLPLLIKEYLFLELNYKVNM